ncbi:hypothetical protein D9M71_736790 [compost metagenome]
MVVVVRAHVFQMFEEAGLDLTRGTQLGDDRDLVGGLPIQIEPRGAARHRQFALVVVVRCVLPVLGVPRQFFAQITVVFEAVLSQKWHGQRTQRDR